MQKLNQLKFPIGEFKAPDVITKEILESWIQDFELFPKRIEELIKGLNAEQLNWKYRPNGWDINQVVHHCADSHLNSLMRFKLALTEEHPTIRPYYEDRWALLPDYNTKDLYASLSILNGVHIKLSLLFKGFSEQDLQRTFLHPEHNTIVTLKENIGIYAWHSNHHLAHVKQALNAKGKYN